MASQPYRQQQKTMTFESRTANRPKFRAASKAGRPVDGLHKTVVEDGDPDDKLCCVCCEEIHIFAKGLCDHVICFKCSSRIRVLCEENYCAVCRMDLKKVAFIENQVPFKELNTSRMAIDVKLGIFFENDQIKQMHEDLLLNICPDCDEPTKLRNFGELRRHVRQKHDKQYCDLCVKYLKIFPSEFRSYTRSELVTHRKTGDVEDTSYKGHPQCDFCSERYFDDEEFLLHLRKHHFWCHFCEKDGKQVYFSDYSELRSHFRIDHFLCEEHECAQEKYTSVFRSDIDFQAHKISRHSKKMSKMAAKQARQLNVDIDYGTRSSQKPRTYTERRAVGEQSKKRASGQENGSSPTPENMDNMPQNLGNQASGNQSVYESEHKKEQSDVPPRLLHEDFPSLNQEQGNKNVSWSKYGHAVDINSEAAFPTLGNGAGARPRTKPSPEKVGKAQRKAPLNVQPKTSIADVCRVNPSISIGMAKAELPRAKKTKPPPGMSKSSGKSTENSAKAPPGISSKPEMPLRPVDFGQPTENKARPKQQGPGVVPSSSSSTERNISLVGLIKSLLADGEFNQFKDLSGSFRRTEISASHYYGSISALLGSNLPKIFFELVNLLPDERKQDELLRIHAQKGDKNSSSMKSGSATVLAGKAESNLNGEMSNKHASKQSTWQVVGDNTQGKQASKEATWQVVGDNTQGKQASKQASWQVVGDNTPGKQESTSSRKKNDKETVVCPQCKSVVFKKELRMHMDTHIDESDFPALPVPVGNSQLPFWIKSRDPIRSAWGQPK